MKHARTGPAMPVKQEPGHTLPVIAGDAVPNVDEWPNGQVRDLQDRHWLQLPGDDRAVRKCQSGMYCLELDMQRPRPIESMPVFVCPAVLMRSTGAEAQLLPFLRHAEELPSLDWVVTKADTCMCGM